MGGRLERNELICQRCGNQDPAKFKTIKKGTYCTACLEFGRLFVGEPIAIQVWKEPSALFSDYELSYALTQAQQKCSRQLIEYVRTGHDVLIYACCGAGKTEIIYPLVTDCLKQHRKIGIAIPRKDVVIELAQRFQKAYPKKTVCAVYGGHHELLDGDIILCTTHQLYRYYQAFDVLILDEVDAFPYKGNPVLQRIARQACKGNFVYLSATPDNEMKRKVAQGTLKQITLFRRPHGHPLCIPKVKTGFAWMNYLHLFHFLNRHFGKTVLVFVPTIAQGKRMMKLIRLIGSVWPRRCCLFTSEVAQREEMMHQIRDRNFDIVVCTTVLERGITIPDVQVAVWDAHHPVFDEAALIQILGRVGRTKEAYEGEGLLLCRRKSSSVISCLRSLKMMNAA